MWSQYPVRARPGDFDPGQDSFFFRAAQYLRIRSAAAFFFSGVHEDARFSAGVAPEEALAVFFATPAFFFLVARFLLVGAGEAGVDAPPSVESAPSSAEIWPSMASACSRRASRADWIMALALSDMWPAMLHRVDRSTRTYLRIFVAGHRYRPARAWSCHTCGGLDDNPLLQEEPRDTIKHLYLPTPGPNRPSASKLTVKLLEEPGPRRRRSDTLPRLVELP